MNSDSVPSFRGNVVIDLLQQLQGLPWNEATMAYTTGLNPSNLRVSLFGDPVTTDFWPTRVTVYLREDRLIDRIEQEVQVDLPRSIEHGHALKLEIDKLIEERDAKDV